MMDIFKQLYQEIMDDLENKQYTDQDYPPIYSAHRDARILIVGQAPGLKVQESGILFNDLSGVRLRQWLNVSDEQFYDPQLFSILPMDFYYPGKGQSGDLPPRKKFASKWHPLFLKEMNQIKLKILIGKYATDYYLPNNQYKNLTETVKHYKEFLPSILPIVHPSPLNNRWLKKNPWFEVEVIPVLQSLVKEIIE